jgi:Uma2 family endonuclease
MSEAKQPVIWTWEAYRDWEAQQPLRYELVDGQVYAMGGGTAEHDTIANNLRGELRTRMRGKPCRPHGPDLKVKAGKDPLSRRADRLRSAGIGGVACAGAGGSLRGVVQKHRVDRPKPEAA